MVDLNKIIIIFNPEYIFIGSNKYVPNISFV